MQLMLELDDFTTRENLVLILVAIVAPFTVAFRACATSPLLHRSRICTVRARFSLPFTDKAPLR